MINKGEQIELSMANIFINAVTTNILVLNLQGNSHYNY